MKPRHAAALALAGWYLVVSHGGEDWRRGGPYPTRYQCESVMKEYNAKQGSVPEEHLERHPLTHQWRSVPGIGKFGYIGPLYGRCVFYDPADQNRTPLR